MLNAYFHIQGYDVQTVNWGEDAIRACQTNLPDLIILDIGLPDMDGFEVAYRLRNNRRTNLIPIIFLTDRRARSDRLQGLELGADDYLTKPFDGQELCLRVRNAIKRSQQGTLTSPITNLPEGMLVDERLDECLKSTDWAVMMITLTNLNIFRDKYGFVAADDVLRAVNLMIHTTVREVGRMTDFVGHLSGDAFLVVTIPAIVQDLKDQVTNKLQQTLEYFYPINDRERPLMTQERLRVDIKLLDSSQGRFISVEALKKALFESKSI
jgi:DNA-binding response OmpR family regulator